MLTYLLKIGNGGVGDNLMGVARILMVTDIQSFSFYTLTGSNNMVYPQEFSQLGVVGNLWAGQVCAPPYTHMHAYVQQAYTHNTHVHSHSRTLALSRSHKLTNSHSCTLFNLCIGNFSNIFWIW